jgi:GNAT superfamily N-acetyltransferase
MAESVELIRYEDLDELLGLYRLLHPEDPEPENNPDTRRIWDEIFNDRCLFYPIVRLDGKIVATCTLAIVKNLTRGQRPYAVVENVMTHPDYRKKGYGTKVLRKATEIAVKQGCYKVMLLTGTKREETLRFYENAGFIRGAKTGLIINLEGKKE